MNHDKCACFVRLVVLALRETDMLNDGTVSLALLIASILPSRWWDVRRTSGVS